MIRIQMKILNAWLALMIAMVGLVGVPTSALAAQVELVEQFNTFLKETFPSAVSTRQAAEELADFFVKRTKKAANSQGLKAIRDVSEALTVYTAQNPNDTAIGFKLRAFTEALTEKVEAVKSRRSLQGGLLTAVTTVGAIAGAGHVVGWGDNTSTLVIMSGFIGLMAGFVPTVSVERGRQEVISAIKELMEPYSECSFLLSK